MDLSSAFQPLIAALWYLLLLAAMAGLIAAAIGNQDPRLLRDRDKACAQYKVLQGDVR